MSIQYSKLTDLPDDLVEPAPGVIISYEELVCQNIDSARNRASLVSLLAELEFQAAALRQANGISRREVLNFSAGNYTGVTITRAEGETAVLQVVDMSLIGGSLETTESEATGYVAPDVQPWAQQLINAYHPGKTVSAIAYTRNTATVLFLGDANPYKLYKPTGAV